MQWHLCQRSRFQVLNLRGNHEENIFQCRQSLNCSISVGWEWLAKHLLKRILAEKNLSEPKRQTAAVQKEMLNGHRAARCKRNEGQLLCSLLVWHQLGGCVCSLWLCAERTTRAALALEHIRENGSLKNCNKKFQAKIERRERLQTEELRKEQIQPSWQLEGLLGSWCHFVKCWSRWW